MYVSAKGMGRYRGLGLNCPGDPGCPGYVAPGSSDYQTSLLQEILANQVDAPPAVFAGPPASSSQWIPGVSNTVIGAAGLVVGALLLRGGR
jgi:hypothetical protein